MQNTLRSCAVAMTELVSTASAPHFSGMYRSPFRAIMRSGLGAILRGVCLAAKFCESFLLPGQRWFGQPMAEHAPIYWTRFTRADWTSGTQISQLETGR